MCGIEVYWQSFQYFQNHNYSVRKTVRKNDKNAPKLVNIAFRENRVVLCTFAVLILLIV